MDHMSPLDSMFLHVEDGITHMHIGSCSVFEGPAPGYDEIVSIPPETGRRPATRCRR